MIRQRLGFSAPEWNALSWYWQRTYLEEMEADDERAAYHQEHGTDPPDDLFDPGEPGDRDEQLDALVGMGITVNRH